MTQRTGSVDLEVSPHEHPVEAFWRWIDEIPRDAYPDELVPVDGRNVEGVAGFPASHGLYAPCGWDHSTLPPFPHSGVMLVGHHLDAETSYLRALREGRAHGDPCPDAKRMRFWSRLYALLDTAEIPREAIFVTNVHPALVSGDDPRRNIRVGPGDAWASTIRELFVGQLEVMEPSLVVALGRAPQRFIEDILRVDLSNPPSAVRKGRWTAAAVRHPSAAQSREAAKATAEVLAEALSDR